jgi:hypothetical protein
MKKYALLLAVLSLSTSAWGFGIGDCGPGSFGLSMSCPPPSPCPTPCPNPGAVIGGDYAGQSGLLYCSPCIGARRVEVDSCQGAFSNQGHIGCFDWGCSTSFGDHDVSYGCPSPWGSFTFVR